MFSKPGGGTRIGERLASLPLSLCSDPARPGLQCSPFVIAHASSRDSSVFDNGLPLGRTDWIADGDAGRADPDPSYGPAVRASRSRPRSTT